MSDKLDKTQQSTRVVDRKLSNAAVAQIRVLN